MRWLRDVAKTLDRVVRLDLHRAIDFFLLIGIVLLFWDVQFLLERAGSEYLDLDVDLGIVFTFLGSFFYLVYRLWDGLRGRDADWYEALAIGAIAVPLLAVVVRIATTSLTFITALGLMLLGLAVMGLSVLLARVRLDPQDSFVRAWIVAWGLVGAVGIAWAVSSVSTMMLWGVVGRPALQKRVVAERPIIAITLSGGGYRAALTHAGVLWTLDQAGLSPTVLCVRRVDYGRRL